MIYPHNLFYPNFRTIGFFLSDIEPHGKTIHLKTWKSIRANFKIYFPFILRLYGLLDSHYIFFVI